MYYIINFPVVVQKTIDWLPSIYMDECFIQQKLFLLTEQSHSCHWQISSTTYFWVYFQILVNSNLDIVETFLKRFICLILYWWLLGPWGKRQQKKNILFPTGSLNVLRHGVRRQESKILPVPMIKLMVKHVTYLGANGLPNTHSRNKISNSNQQWQTEADFLQQR